MRPTAMGLVLLTLVAVPSVGQTPPGFDGIPNVSFDYYDLAGRDPKAIRAAMVEVRPTDPNDGERVDALTRWAWRWSWQTTPGGCDLANVNLTYSATVRLPRLKDRAVVPANVLKDWDAYIAALERHEAGHVRNSYAGRAEIRSAIAGATCATANAVAMAAVARVSARDMDFDRLTHHGRDGGAVF